MASRQRGTLYIGMTSDLIQRIWQHKNDQTVAFTKKYGIHTLVWHEMHAAMELAISREKSLKAWKRIWKIQLIESINPEWRGFVRGYPLNSNSGQNQNGSQLSLG